MSTPRETTALHLQVPHDWAYLDDVREFVTRYFTRRISPAFAERIAMLVQELLENAIKYGDPSNEPELTVGLDGRAFAVVVANRAVPSRIALLERAIAAAAEPGRDPLTSAMRRAEALPSGRAMMGIARVRTEARVDLSLAIDLDNLVRVTARGTL